MRDRHVRGAIADDSAVSFATGFYQALGFGRDVQTAFELGRGQIVFDSLEGEDTPKLMTAPGVDAGTIFLVGGRPRREPFGDPPPPDPPPSPEPYGGLRLDDKSYVKRQADVELIAAVRRRDSIVLVQEPRQVGKTSLLKRGIQAAHEAGMVIVETDLRQFDKLALQSLKTFYRAVMARFAAQLGLDVRLGTAWDPQLDTGMNFKRFLQEPPGGSPHGRVYFPAKG